MCSHLTSPDTCYVNTNYCIVSTGLAFLWPSRSVAVAHPEITRDACDAHALNTCVLLRGLFPVRTRDPEQRFDPIVSMAGLSDVSWPSFQHIYILKIV